jgi:hypothetical protein
MLEFLRRRILSPCITAHCFKDFRCSFFDGRISPNEEMKTEPGACSVQTKQRAYVVSRYLSITIMCSSPDSNSSYSETTYVKFHKNIGIHIQVKKIRVDVYVMYLDMSS